jgi:hypothetical protein
VIYQKHLLKSVVILCSVIGIFLLLPLISNGKNLIFATVVINEIYPKTEDISQTWIELYNNGNESVSLDRWKIENTSGNPTFFSLNASSIIPGKGFLTFPQSQYGFTLNKEGDTVRLFDASNNKVDEQSYQGIIGYYQSVGRSTDGAGVWTNCTSSTQNSSNNCIAPPPTTTPLPTETPGPTMTPYPTDAPMVVATSIVATPIAQLQSASTENNLPLPTTTPTPATTTQPAAFPLAIVLFIIIVIIWIVIIGIIMWKKKTTK